MLLVPAGQKSGYINKSNDWDIKTITKANKSSCLIRSVNIKNTRQIGWLISNNANRLSSHSCVSNYNILSKLWHNFKEIIFVYYFFNQLLHIIRNIRIFRNKLLDIRSLAIKCITCSSQWRVFHVV